MSFDNYKREIIGHELGHWVSAKHLGLNVGAIKIKIDTGARGQPFHSAATTIFIECNLNSVDDVYRHVANRISILFSGVLSQFIFTNQDNTTTAKDLLQTYGQDDESKIYELLHIARGVKFSGKMSKDNEICQKKQISDECWSKSLEIVEKRKDEISFICQKISNELFMPGKWYCFCEDKLNNWLTEYNDA